MRQSGTPYFDTAIIFAANINGKSENHPEIYFNPQASELLNNSDSIAKLHAKGIKVILTLLGNHQNAGWSCMTDESSAKGFANKIIETLERYNLDGVDIDDEYSKCDPNDYSMIMIAKALKEDPRFQNKLLTKALWRDKYIFQSEYKGAQLADFLDYGWEMGYFNGGPAQRLQPYLNYGMTHNQLLLGLHENGNIKQSSYWLQQTYQQGYQGIMYFNLTKHSLKNLKQLSKAESLGEVFIEPDCLE